MSYHTIPYHTIAYVVSSQITSYHVMLYHVMSYRCLRKTLLQIRGHLGVLAWKTQNRPVKSGLCCCFAGHKLAKGVLDFHRHRRYTLRRWGVTWCCIGHFARDMYERNSIGGEVRHGVASGVSCETSLIHDRMLYTTTNKCLQCLLNIMYTVL